jgi:DNA repair photolyase
MSIIPALRRLRQEDLEFEASLKKRERETERERERRRRRRRKKRRREGKWKERRGGRREKGGGGEGKEGRLEETRQDSRCITDHREGLAKASGFVKFLCSQYIIGSTCLLSQDLTFFLLTPKSHLPRI